MATRSSRASGSKRCGMRSSQPECFCQAAVAKVDGMAASGRCRWTRRCWLTRRRNCSTAPASGKPSAPFCARAKYLIVTITQADWSRGYRRRLGTRRRWPARLAQRSRKVRNALRLPPHSVVSSLVRLVAAGSTCGSVRCRRSRRRRSSRATTHGGTSRRTPSSSHSCGPALCPRACLERGAERLLFAASQAVDAVKKKYDMEESKL